MEITLFVGSLLVLLLVTATLTLSVSLFLSKKGNVVANKYLSLFLLVNSILALLMVFEFEALMPKSFIYSLVSFQLLTGPIIYFYTKISTQVHFTWHKHYLLHGLPTLLSLTIWQLQLLSNTNSIECVWADTNCSVLFDGRFIHIMAAYLSIFLYLFHSLKLLIHHTKNMQNSYSEIESVSLNWLRTLIIAMLLLTFWSLTDDLYTNIYGKNSPSLLFGVSIYGYSTIVIAVLVGYFGLLQEKIDLEQIPTSSEKAEQTSNTKYQTSSLTEEKSVQIWQALNHCMETDKPYLEVDLKIATLADRLNIQPNHLSETINGYAKKSFYEFINKYRIEEAKALLLDDNMSNLSVSDIGYNSGFNSNSTFFSQFKKLLDTTPKAFRKREKASKT